MPLTINCPRCDTPITAQDEDDLVQKVKPTSARTTASRTPSPASTSSPACAKSPKRNSPETSTPAREQRCGAPESGHSQTGAGPQHRSRQR